MICLASAAADYASRGWLVIPLKPRSKTPATPRGKNDASLDPEQLAQWFPSCSDRNVGILTGVRSRLLVVDIDPRNGGIAGLERLEHAYGKLPETLRSATGGGGTHYFYQLPLGIGALYDRPNVNRFGGVDLKADGYVVAPPSIHPDTGRAYAWENSVPVVEAPAWLIELVSGGTPGAVNPLQSGKAILEGGRNDTLFRLACGLRAQGAAAEGIRTTITLENAERCVPPLSAEEVEQVVLSAMRYEPGSLLPETDLGNARRLVQLMDGNARYEPNSRAWFVWEGRFWARDEDGRVVRLAKQVVDALLAEAILSGDPDVRKRRISFARKSQASARIAAMIELARTEHGVSIQFGAFDRELHLLNCANGMIDLRSGQLLPHARDTFVTQFVEAVFEPSAPCPNFERFFSDILSGDAELIEYLQSAAGYAATGETREQCFFVLHGDGANGKSTFLNAIRSLLGSYAKHTPTDTLLAKVGGSSNDLARLAGARFVTASEANADQRMADSLLKQVTGDEPITARFLFKEFISFQPQFKLFLATNQLPQINGNDPAMWRRVRTIPFTRVFTSEQQDRGLAEKLADERAGILAWIVRGAVNWYTDGLKTPRAVQQANSEYQAEMDSIGQFIEERCERTAETHVSASALYSNYRLHANDNGRSAVNATQFGRTLTTKGFQVIKKSGAKFRVGLTLRTGGWEES